jgi:hypothetical protein
VPRRSPVHVAIDLALVGAIGSVLLLLFLRPTAHQGLTFPVGPDLPVYLWWTRIGAAEGLSAAGWRPGMPALLPVASSSLGVGAVASVAGLQYALGPAIGLAGAALVRGLGTGSRLGWVAAGILGGVFATFLGAGYVANLAFVAPYLAAAAALARRTRHGTVAAALLLAGGGLAHPQFFGLGVGILAVTAGWSWVFVHQPNGHRDAARILAALLGASVLLSMSLVSLLVGASPLGVDTSKDAFMRRTGQWATLRETYLGRFRENRGRYALWISGPLAITGALTARGIVRRFLSAWLAVTVVALPIGVLTGWYPPDRILTFAFCVPLLAALGIAWLGERLRVAWLAWPAGVVLVALMAAPAIREWNEQQVYLSSDDVHDANVAARIAATTPPGTALIYVANDPTTSGLFLASHVANLARATVPGDRVRDVYVFVGSPADLLAGHPSVRGDPLHDLASSTTFAELPTDRPQAVLVVREFDRDPDSLDTPGLSRWDVAVAASLTDPRPLAPLAGELTPSTPNEIEAATWRTLLLLAVVGFGWALWALEDSVGAAAGAPAFGVAAMTLVAFAVSRLGLSLGDGATATVVSALAGGLGYALVLVRLARRGPRGGRVLERQTEPEPPT